MFAHVAWGRLKEGAWEEYERIWSEVVLPTVGEIPGLERRMLIHSTEDPDEGMSLSLWDSADSLQNYIDSGQLDQLSSRLAHVYKDEWWLKSFEVRFDESA